MPNRKDLYEFTLGVLIIVCIFAWVIGGIILYEKHIDTFEERVDQINTSQRKPQ